MVRQRSTSKSKKKTTAKRAKSSRKGTSARKKSARGRKASAARTGKKATGKTARKKAARKKARRKAAPGAGKKRTAGRKTSRKTARKTASRVRKKTARVRKAARKKVAGTRKRVEKVKKKAASKAVKVRKKLSKAARARMEKLKAMLEDRRDEIIASIRRAREDSVEDNRRTFSEVGDLVSASLEKEMAFKFGEYGVNMLREIDSALEKLKEGSYGTCEDCGKNIGVKRLEVVPFARLCIKCKSKEEEGSGGNR